MLGAFPVGRGSERGRDPKQGPLRSAMRVDCCGKVADWPP
jgi:hypothetical protein